LLNSFPIAPKKDLKTMNTNKKKLHYISLRRQGRERRGIKIKVFKYGELGQTKKGRGRRLLIIKRMKEKRKEKKAS